MEGRGSPVRGRRTARPRRDVDDEIADSRPPRLDSAAGEEAEDAAELTSPFDLRGAEPNDGGSSAPMAARGGARERKRIAPIRKLWEERGERREREQVHDGGDPP